MLILKKEKGESIEAFIRRFKNTVSDEGVLLEAKKKMRYRKDSLIKYEKGKHKKWLNYLDHKREAMYN